MQTREEIKRELQDLADKLERYDEAYHQKDAPLVSDAARTARTPSRGRSTEMLSAMVVALTGMIVSVPAAQAL